MPADSQNPHPDTISRKKAYPLACLVWDLGGERLASAIELAQGSRYSRDKAWGRQATRYRPTSVLI